ncbi:unnamed protein product, partial [marine sediment metagenome]
VVTTNASLSFAELLEGSRGIAATLAESKIGKGDRIAVWMDKTPQCVQAILGIMESGAAYVPLDPRAPWRRCHSVMANCGVAVLVVDEPKLSYVDKVSEGCDLKLLITDCEATQRDDNAFSRPNILLSEAIENPRDVKSPPSLDDLAYILYTSGSTGTPKGVAHTHRSGLAFVRWIQDVFGIVPEDVFSSHAPFHFDLSISDLYASLGTGAKVHLISSTEAMLAPYLVKQMPAWGITIWYSTPSILSSMLDVGELEARGFGQ